MKHTYTTKALHPPMGEPVHLPDRRSCTRGDAIRILESLGADAGVEVDGLPVGSVSELRAACRVTLGAARWEALHGDDFRARLAARRAAR